jgi:hypothetical protein
LSGKIEKEWFYAVCESYEEAVASYEQYQAHQALQSALTGMQI